MTPRKKWTWSVDLAAVESGRSLTERVTAYWSPDHETTREGVTCAAIAQANVRTGKRHMVVRNPTLVLS